jgi:hypothetical protein
MRKERKKERKKEREIMMRASDDETQQKNKSHIYLCGFRLKTRFYLPN